MAYRVELLSAAQRHIKKLERLEQGSVLDALESLREEPRPEGVKKLGGFENVWRVKVRGSFRVAYQIHDDRLLVLVIAVGDRKLIYELVKRILEG